MPNFCPQKLKYVVMSMNSRSSIISSTSSSVFCLQVLLLSSLSLITSNDSATGVFVNKEATSREMSISPVFTCNQARSSARCCEFLTNCSVLPNIGAKTSARKSKVL